MKIEYLKTIDLLTSAKMTYENMRTYYQRYSVDWDKDKIAEQIHPLENWDILFNGSIVGAIRLAYEKDACWIRDLQVDAHAQNKGIGSNALIECERLALAKGLDSLKLRVFKISPAYHLYVRSGFIVDSEDDRFYYMSKMLKA